ncbi:LuxR C-terminal-related transcriptional regulator [Agrobacterium sp. CG160-95]
MIRTSFVAIALSALVGFTATAPAMANDVRIEQYGWSNSAGGAQEGYGNRIRTYQNGGYSVPLHMPGALQAIVTFGAEKIDLSTEAKGILHIVAIYAHNRLRALLEQQSGAGRKNAPYITQHERDVIRWCAEGKTNWEIGQILGRSEKTVQHELHNAQRKMNCVNRAQLVAEAIRIGIIR